MQPQELSQTKLATHKDRDRRRKLLPHNSHLTVLCNALKIKKHLYIMDADIRLKTNRKLCLDLRQRTQKR